MLLSTVEKTSKCSNFKWSHEPLAGAFTAKFWTFLASFLWSIYKSIDHEKEKINCASITSFVWSARLLTIALDQSALEKSLNYGNKCPHNGKPLDSVQVPKSKPFYWCRKTSLQSKYWIEFIICLFFVNNHSLFAPLYDDCTHWTFVRQFLVAGFFFLFYYYFYSHTC